MAKYMNTKSRMVGEEEKSCQNAAKKNFFGYLYKRKRVCLSNSNLYIIYGHILQKDSTPASQQKGRVAKALEDGYKAIK